MVLAKPSRHTVTKAGLRSSGRTSCRKFFGRCAPQKRLPGFASASTYAVGKVFAQHFAGGGSLLDFDTEAKKEEIAKEFTEARNEGKKSSSKPVVA